MVYTTDKATIRHEDFTEEERNSIEEIIVSKKTKSLHKKAFAGFLYLKKVTFLAPFKRCEIEIFKGCQNLKEVILPEGLSTIPILFLSGSGIENIKIPDSVERIDYGAFQNCPDLKEVVIPESVKCIGSSVFECDSSLEKIVLPSNVSFIDKFAFRQCPETLQIIVEKDSATEKLLHTDRALEIAYDRRSVLKQEKIKEIREVTVQAWFEAGCSELNVKLKVKNAGKFIENRWFDIYFREDLYLSFEDELAQTEAMEEKISHFLKNSRSLENKTMVLKILMLNSFSI